MRFEKMPIAQLHDIPEPLEGNPGELGSALVLSWVIDVWEQCPKDQPYRKDDAAEGSAHNDCHQKTRQCAVGARVICRGHCVETSRRLLFVTRSASFSNVE